MTGRRIIANDLLLGEASSLLAEGKKVRLRAKGDSMRPVIRGGEDTIVLAPPGISRKGDVVLARIRDNRYVVHRIVKIDGDKIILAGDANLYGREYCRVTDVAGIAETVVRRGTERSLRGPRARMLFAIRQMFLPLRRARAKIISLLRKSEDRYEKN